MSALVTPASTRLSALRTAITFFQILALVLSLCMPLSALAVEPAGSPPASPADSLPPAPSDAASPSDVPSDAPTATESPAATETPASAPAETPAPTAPPAGTGSAYIVTFAAGADQDASLAMAGATADSSIPQLHMAAALLTVNQLTALSGDAGVLRIDVDRTRAAETVPTDTSYGDQWSLGTIGWDRVYGSVTPAGSATVALLDTGVDGSHSDLDANLVPGTSILDGSNGLTDANGHGTAMAGIVAAETDNSEGVAGIGFTGVRVMPVTVLGPDGTGQDSDIIAGVVWAADHGADVVLMAFSNYGYSPALQAAIDYAWSRGAVLVAATGNDGSTSATFPAGDRGVIGVASTTASDAVAASSNTGASAFMVAPGEGIVTTSLGGGVASVSGTSAAAAEVAASAALLRALDPAALNGAIVGRLARNADPVGDSSATGNGRLNLARAATDTSNESIQPAGAAPLGSGGPLVGPYVAAQTNFQSFAIGAQSPNPVAPGNSADYALTVGFSGNGSCTVGSFAVTTTLPAGVTAAFSPTSVSRTSTGNQIVTLTLAMVGSTPAGTTPFTVSATGIGGDCNNPRTASASLVITAPANTPPVINRTNSTVTVNEGQTAANSGTWSDVNAGNTVTLTASVGAVTKSGTNASGTWNWSSVTTDGPAQSQTVTITANDGTASTSTTFTLTVSNIAPTATFNAPTPVNEGSSIGLSLTAAADASSVDAASLQFAFDCGLGAGYSALSAAPTATCPTTDNGTRTVKGKVQDKDGAATEYTATVTINNVAPTATFSATSPVNEGSATTLSLTSPSDPSSADMSAGVQYAFDCGTGAGFSLFSATSTATCPTTDSGSRAMKGQIRDKNLAITEYLRTVVIDNVAPTATFSATTPVNEGSSIGLSFSGASDPSSVDTTSGFTYAFDCGSGYGAYSGSASASCLTTDNGSRTVKGRIRDKDGGFTEYIAPVSIANVAPTATFNATASVNEGSSISLSLTGAADASSTDQAAGFTFAFDCGTGYGAFSGVSTASCSTDDNGSRGVKGRVKDKDGGTSEYTATVTIHNVAPTATFNASASVDEGSNIALSLSLPFDPSSIDAGTLTYAFDCGPGYGAFSATASASCPTTDEGTRTVKGMIRDKDGGETEYTASVTIKNVAPAVTPPVVNAPENQGGTEGVAHTFTLGSFTDPGADSPWSITVNWGDGPAEGLPNATVVGPIGTAAHTYDDNGTYTVTVTVTDVDGASGSTTFMVTVANTPPTALLAGDSVDEGSPADVGFSFPVDPSAADTGAGFHYSFSCANDVTALATSYAAAGTATGTTCTFDDGSDAYTVAGRTFDKDGGFTDSTTNVHVANVAPTPTIDGAPASSPEGTEISLTGSATDPSSTDTTAGFMFAWTVTKDGNAFASGAGATFAVTPDDNGSYVVTLTATDKDGGVGSTTATIPVTNVAPTATFTAPTSVDEGSDIGLAFSDPADAGGADVIVGLQFAFDCGDGSGFGAFGASMTTDCATSQDGTRTVKGRVKDKDGGITEYTASVTVNNVAPRVSAGDDATVDEGSPFSAAGSFTDPGADAWSATVDYGAGAGPVALTLNPNNTFSLSHTYADNGSYLVTVVVSDDDTSGSDTLTVTVNNVAPTVSAGADDTINEGDTFIGGGSFSDPGADTWSATVDYGDGSGSQALALNPDGSFRLSHTYADNRPANAPYTVTVTVTDDDGGVGSDTVVVTVLNVAPTVTLSGPASVTESSTAYRYGFLVTDPGADGFTLTEADISCGSGGTLVPGSLSLVAGGGTFDCTFLDGPASPQLSISVADDDGATDSDLLPVTVSNVAPVYSTPELDAADNQHATEGHAQNFDLGSFTDAGVNDHDWAIDVDWGDAIGSHFTAASQGNIDLTSHLYAQDGTFHVTVTVTDKDGGTDSDTFDISVANVAPTVDAGADATLNEGDTFSQAGSFSDPGLDTWTATVDYGEGAGPVALSLNPHKTFGLSHTFAQDGVFTVTVAITDDDTTSNDTATVTVNNVAPRVSAGDDATVDEGSPFSAAGSFSDPGSDTWSATVDYGAGDGPVAVTLNPDNTFSLGHTYADNGSYLVTVVVSDDDTSGSDTLTVTVNNVAPTPAITGAPATSPEGTAISLTGSATDPSPVDTTAGFTWLWTVSKNAVPGYATGTDATFTFTPDDNGTYVVSLQAADKDGGNSTASVTITANNVAPTPAITGAPATSPEGTAISLSGSATDPSPVDTTAGFSWLWSVTKNGSPYGLTGTSATFSFTPDDNGTYVVSLKATDKDGGNATVSKTITVANVAPVVSAGADASINEGGTFTQSGSFTDPGADSWTATVDYGDGTGVQPLTLVGKTFNLSHTYVDNRPANAPYTVTIVVADDDAGSGPDTVAVTVLNVAPTVISAGNQSGSEGASLTLNFGSFTDPGADSPWAVDVNWGDASSHGSATKSSTGSLGTMTHTYADNGTYVVTVKVTDKDTAFSTASFTVTVANVAPTPAITGAPATSPEGSAISLSGSATDPSPVDTTAGFSWLWSVTKNGSPYGVTGTSATFSFTPDDNGTYVVSLKATDKDGGNATVSRTITVANVAPVSASGMLTIDPITGVISANVTWADPGVLDNASVKFEYFRGTAATPAATSTVAVGANVHSASDNVTQLDPGCFTLTARVTITDKDGGVGLRSLAAGATADVWLATFAPPIKQNERNIAKYGNTVPLKVTLNSSCNPSALTTSPSLWVTLIKGSDIAPEGTEIIPASSSAADTGNQLRVQSGGYMYNLTTQGLTQGSDYEVRIRVGSTSGPIIAEAMLQPKK